MSGFLNAYVASALAPFTVMAGPISVTSQRREYALSKWQSAELTVPTNEIDVDWLAVGVCWLMLSDRGQAPWAGFVTPGDLPYQGSSVTVRLDSAGEALLQVNAPTFSAGRRSVRQIMLEALFGLEGAGIRPGAVSGTEFADLNSDMETVQQLIESVVERAGIDFYEETLFDGQRIEFRLHAGQLERPTDIVIGPDDFVESAAVIRTKRPLTQVQIRGGQGNQVAEAERPEPTASRLASLQIGPGVGRVARLVEHRAAGFVREQATARYLAAARSVSQAALTLNLKHEAVQRLRVGDLVRLQVADWLKGLSVDEVAHVHSLEPHEEQDELHALFHLEAHNAN